jgi:hypothetical protein
VKTKVIPVIIQATGTISKSPRQYVTNIPESNKLRKYKQHIAILCTAGSADVQYRTCLTGEITLHVVQIVNREQLLHCVP